MESVLGGGLEYAMIRRITSEVSPNRIAITHPYYRSLQRSQPDRMFSRASTILALSDRVRRPVVDWTPEMGSDASALISDQGIGWFAENNLNEWEPSWQQYVEKAYDAGAFSALSLRVMTAVEAVNGTDPADTIKVFAVHHAMRLLLQCEAASRGAHLFMPQDDQAVLVDLLSYAAKAPPPADIPLPDLSVVKRDPDGKSVALIAFEPPDVASISAVRKDKTVRHYADEVSKLWSVDDPVERDRRAIRAMRAVAAADDARAQMAVVFEAAGWWVKIPAWAGVPWASLAADARDGAAAVFQRRRRQKDWLLVKTSMQDISLRDYLRRTDNF